VVQRLEGAKGCRKNVEDTETEGIEVVGEGRQSRGTAVLPLRDVTLDSLSLTCCSNPHQATSYDSNAPRKRRS
jgi:hypothetical protein